jgi:hypothetical protein
MYNTIKVYNFQLIGDIKGFPIEIVRKMLERQREQIGTTDIRSFQKNRAIGRNDELFGDTILGKSIIIKGFTWEDTVEGQSFWDDVILSRQFDKFFEKYPRLKDKKKESLLYKFLNKRHLVQKFEKNVWNCYHRVQCDEKLLHDWSFKQKYMYNRFYHNFKQTDQHIVRAFTWCDTAEGYNFWSIIDTKWRKLLKSK